MNKYKDFIKPYLRQKDGYNHVVMVKYSPETIGDSDKADDYIDRKITNKIDDIIVSMQRDKYEIISLSLESVNDSYGYIVIRYK